VHHVRLCVLRQPQPGQAAGGGRAAHSRSHTCTARCRHRRSAAVAACQAPPPGRVDRVSHAEQSERRRWPTGAAAAAGSPAESPPGASSLAAALSRRRLCAWVSRPGPRSARHSRRSIRTFLSLPERPCPGGRPRRMVRRRWLAGRTFPARSRCHAAAAAVILKMNQLLELRTAGATGVRRVATRPSGSGRELVRRAGGAALGKWRAESVSRSWRSHALARVPVRPGR